MVFQSLRLAPNINVFVFWALVKYHFSGMPMRLKSYLIVFVQLASLVFILLTGPLFARQISLLALEFIGIFLGLWAIFEFRKTTFRITPEVREGAILVVSGPYRFIRHPMYTGLIFIVAALILDLFTTMRLIAGLILFFDLLVKIRFEEDYLNRHFKNYKQYARYTYKIIPFIY